MPVDLLVNGVRRHVETLGEESLLSVLREQLDLTGTKYGCGEGQCGACTVLIDGRPTRSCLTRVAGLQGAAITTIEGLAENGRLHPVQEAFLEAGAMQCGYCTPGMIMEGVALLRRQASLSEADIARAMSAHVCRCCTYPRIVRALRTAAARAAGSQR
jgi:aerobic-type carbon monoxide dehydrogenase small subunit (CoxS/CutS family)